MRRRAFTLTELLVVVVIIGVLSAVVLPKFSKVIETRKTTEAEELMAAVRTEQEARCTLSKNYTASTGSLGSYKDGKNFDYTLGTVGMTASAKSGKYTLEMPSYADGRICCSSGCDSLNKNYPLCSELINRTDYTVGNEDCGVAKVEDPCANGGCEETCTVPGNTTKTESCGCTNSGTKTQSFDVSTCSWGSWSACSEKETNCNPEPDEPEPQEGECTDGETKIMGQTGDGCANVVKTCTNGEWPNATTIELKEGSECWSQQSQNGQYCVQCHWNKCPSNKVEMEGICCLPEQKVVNGKCLYKYRPNRFNTGVLVACHGSTLSMIVNDKDMFISEEQFNSGYMGYLYQYGTYAAYKEAITKSQSGYTVTDYGGYSTAEGPSAHKPKYCTPSGYTHFRGGSLPYITDPGPGDCTPHHSHVSSGNWWNGGEKILGSYVYGSDQAWCDNNCGPQATCNKKGIISQSAPDKCDAYHCENGWHCDNTAGTGVALECIRE